MQMLQHRGQAHALSAALFLSLLVSGCAAHDSSAAASAFSPVGASSSLDTAAVSDAGAGWTIVGLGDSFTKTQNARGDTYLDLFAADLQETRHVPVAVNDLSDDANTSAKVADDLRHDANTREAVADADIVLVSVGGNDSDPFAVYPPGTCAPSQPLARCLQVYAPTFARNYGSIFRSIDRLRAGRPTALRVTSADNPFVGWSEAPTETFGVDFYRQVAEAETAAACRLGAAHHALCVDYLHLFGGADGTLDPAPYLGPDHAHPGDAGIRLIADTLMALDVPELR
jgi:lysophospholipase L1-like esterase